MEQDTALPGAAAYIDPASGTTYPLNVPRWRGEDGPRPLMITPLPGIGPKSIDASCRSLWRYAAALPVAVAEPISLGEGCTPLVMRRFRGTQAAFKLEWFAPTGSFKDRGTTVMASVLRQQGIGRMLEDSSGNGGASVAAYAAAGGLRAKILVPASTPPAKTIQMRAYGAEIELVPGSRQDTADEALRQAADIFYASHNWQAFFLQGTKTLAYELWEDFGFLAPDNVIIPTGAGSNVLGCDIGFGELLRHGEIERLPRLFAAQPQHCAPIHASFRNEGEPEVRPTIAEGTAIARPVRLAQVVDAVRRSGGDTVAVSEAEIVRATLDLAALGLMAEPTSALAAAAYSDLLGRGSIDPRETTVIVLTGSGLKAAARFDALLPRRAA